MAQAARSLLIFKRRHPLPDSSLLGKPNFRFRQVEDSRFRSQPRWIYWFSATVGDAGLPASTWALTRIRPWFHKREVSRESCRLADTKRSKPLSVPEISDPASRFRENRHQRCRLGHQPRLSTVSRLN